MNQSFFSARRLLLSCSFLFISLSSQAQSDIHTDSFKVAGNCGMCKERIEDAAYVKGVKRATWNEATQMLTVIYRSGKVSVSDIETRVANAGHATAHVEAPEAAYRKLPECCQYKTNTCKH